MPPLPRPLLHRQISSDTSAVLGSKRYLWRGGRGRGLAASLGQLKEGMELLKV